MNTDKLSFQSTRFFFLYFNGASILCLNDSERFFSTWKVRCRILIGLATANFRLEYQQPLGPCQAHPVFAGAA